MTQAIAHTAARRGRPPATSARTLELVALRLFTEQGYEATTVDQVAAGAGVSRRTFFRYFDSKAGVLWGDFDREVTALTAALAAADPALPLLDAVRTAVVAVNTHSAEDLPELLARMRLVATVPELAAGATVHYDAWEQAVTAFAARRTGLAPTDLLPRALGRATLATCRAAYECWVDSGRTDRLTGHLDDALRALARGFAPAG